MGPENVHQIMAKYSFCKIDYYETVQEAINKLISVGDSLVVIRRDGTLYNLLSQIDIEFLKTYEPNRKLIEILDPTDSFYLMMI